MASSLATRWIPDQRKGKIIEHEIDPYLLLRIHTVKNSLSVLRGAFPLSFLFLSSL